MALPADDLTRKLTVASPEDQPHIGLVGDTYTILLSGKDTAGRYCMIDMHVPPGGGPGAHRHDFEETFTVVEGEIEFTFRGETSVVRAGQSVHIPANAPHSFRNQSKRAVRLLCIASPAGLDEFFREVGVQTAGRTVAPPVLDSGARLAFMKKAVGLAPQYRTEILKP